MNNDKEKCEGCDKEASEYDSEGVCLCSDCFKELMNDSLLDDGIKTANSDQTQVTPCKYCCPPILPENLNQLGKHPHMPPDCVPHS